MARIQLLPRENRFLHSFFLTRGMLQRLPRWFSGEPLSLVFGGKASKVPGKYGERGEQRAAKIHPSPFKNTKAVKKEGGLSPKIFPVKGWEAAEKKVAVPCAKALLAAAGKNPGALQMARSGDSFSQRLAFSEARNRIFAGNKQVVEGGKFSQSAGDSLSLRLGAAGERAAGTANIQVDLSGMKNTLERDVDIDDLISKLTEELSRALLHSAEGVHW